LSPKVLKFDGPSKDGRRHRRGTYLLVLAIAIARTSQKQIQIAMHIATLPPSHD
jgi:hypothetical protein